MVVCRPPREVQGWFPQRAGPVRGRLAGGLGVLLSGRRTVASWLRGRARRHDMIVGTRPATMCLKSEVSFSGRGCCAGTRAATVSRGTLGGRSAFG
jgi:hypothetical protein